MSNNCNTIANILLRGGTDQLHRSNDTVDPSDIELHGFGLSEWMQFAYNFASNVNFFDDTTGGLDGDWEAFFKDEAATKALLADLEATDELTPHLTLFICFLRLLEFSKDRMNNITKRHLDFYYQDVLQIEKLPPTYDTVHIIFELSKSIVHEKLDAGTKLNAGKDSNGIQRFYELSDETVVNTSKANEFKSLYFDPDYANPKTGLTEPQYYMKAATAANTLNGVDEPLTEDQSTWYGFGYNHNRTSAPFEELPDASIGFAIGSKVLQLSEGTRHIQFEINFDQTISQLDFTQLAEVLDVCYTNEKGWSDPIPLKSSFSFTFQSSNLSYPSVSYSTGVNTSTKIVRLLVGLEPADKAVTAYNEKIHQLGLETTQPVFKFVLKTNSSDGLAVYKTFIKKVKFIDTKVHVSGMRKLQLDNDQGSLNPNKPMNPFTSVPVKGSSFSVYHEEVFSKIWDKVEVSVGWKNAPTDFQDWYSAYLDRFKKNFSPANYLTSFDSNGLPYLSVDQNKSSNNSNGTSNSYSNLIVWGAGYFKATGYIKLNGTWKIAQIPATTLFNGSPYSTTFGMNGTSFTNQDTEGIRISLNQSFLHEMYPKLYATALSKPESTTPLPNEPYAPLTEDVSLSYTAHDRILLNDPSENAFANSENAFFHQDAFGYALQHPYLRSKLTFLASTDCTLVPIHCRGGELYIGLEGADNLQNVSLLIQVLEGSENKQTATFLGNQGVTWEILCSNHWKALDSTLLLENGTDNFLQTGIVKFKIPKEATNDNTRLPSGKMWVRAKMLKSFDAVCQVVNIHAQVGVAKFTDNKNELSHLDKGLPAETITKLYQRLSTVKKVSQPYNSYGGVPAENDAQYYRRVSERLRHKNRAITMWDYEHIALQEFNELFRVKCLNHTGGESFTAAGHVTLIVIPDTVNKNVFNRFQPRVSTAMLNRIKDFISNLTSLHVKLHVENPDYEEATVSLKVKFQSGLDDTIYKIKLNEDIISFLSPWAVDESLQVDFGRTLNISVLINYIEKLSYVDYLQDVNLSIDGGAAVRDYTPSTPKAIMVSATQHKISTDIITCEPTAQIITEQCQQ